MYQIGNRHLRFLWRCSALFSSWSTLRRHHEDERRILQEGLVAHVLSAPFSFDALPIDHLMPAGQDMPAFHENYIP